jgi:hypothetical protein
MYYPLLRYRRHWQIALRSHGKVKSTLMQRMLRMQYLFMVQEQFPMAKLRSLNV